MDYKLHNPATKRSVNPYTDNYTGFIWNGHHSSDFNCFIENTGHLTFEPAPDFSNSTVSPAFYDGALYTGTQTQSKKIQLNLVFYQVTLEDFNQALAWLDRKVVSSFLLDYNPNWRYQCKLASLGVTEKYVDGYCIDESHGSFKKRDLYICRMQVSFETVDIHNAISTYANVVSRYGICDCMNIYGKGAVGTNISDHYQFKALSYTPIRYAGNNPRFNLVVDVHNGRTATYVYQNIVTIRGIEYFKWRTDAPAMYQYIVCPKQMILDCLPFQPTIILSNFYPYPTSFRIHLTNFTTKNVIINQIQDNNAIPICSISLNLDDNQPISLHYDSKTGAVTTINQLINSLHNGNGDLLCNYCATLSNITIPANSTLQLSIPDFNGSIMIDYDYCTAAI